MTKLSYKLTTSVPILFVLLIEGFKMYSVQPVFKENTHGFLRYNKSLNDNVNINTYTDGIEVYEDDNYLPNYSKHNKLEITEPTTNSNFINDKQLVEYFDRKHLIDMWRGLDGMAP